MPNCCIFLPAVPVLAVVGLLALRQISLTNALARTNSARDAYRVAAQQVQFYLQQIIPLINKFDSALSEREDSYLRNAVVKIVAIQLSLSQ